MPELGITIAGLIIGILLITLAILWTTKKRGKVSLSVEVKNLLKLECKLQN